LCNTQMPVWAKEVSIGLKTKETAGKKLLQRIGLTKNNKTEAARKVLLQSAWMLWGAAAKAEVHRYNILRSKTVKNQQKDKSRMDISEDRADTQPDSWADQSESQCYSDSVSDRKSSTVQVRKKSNDHKAQGSDGPQFDSECEESAESEESEESELSASSRVHRRRSVMEPTYGDACIEDEQIENKRLNEILQAKESDTLCTVSASASALLDGHLHSNMHYTCLPHTQALIRWKDTFGNTAAHHTALLGLRRSLKFLFGMGASKWVQNSVGDMPVSLADGFTGLSPSRFALYKACMKGGILLPLKSKVGIQKESQLTANTAAVRSAELQLVRMAVATSEGYQTPKSLQQVIRYLLEKRFGDALELSNKLVSECVHARAYTALALLRAGYCTKAVVLELNKYLSQLLDCPTNNSIDPIVYYVHYSVWAAAGQVLRKNDRRKAAHALRAFLTYPAFAAQWTSHKEQKLDGPELDSDSSNYEHCDKNGIGAESDNCDSDTEDRKPDDPETEWQVAKQQHSMASAAMDKLMNLTGLKEVKRSAIQIVKAVLLKSTRPTSVKAELSMNFLFLGNPGCGKTTVARLLGAAMSELGFRQNSIVQETSAQAILKMKPDPATAFASMMNSATGGTIFIDEAYRFTPNKAGHQPNDSNNVLDYLLEAVEQEGVRETTSIILAGYKDEVETLLAYNPGFASRFANQFIFEDFNEKQLRQILQTMVSARGLHFESERTCGVPIARIIARRIGRHSQKKGFGNARAVRNMVEKIVGQQTQRLGSARLRGDQILESEYTILTKDDSIGPRPDYSSLPMLKQLQSMVGIPKVKQSILKLVDLQLQNYDREILGERPELISLHRVFHGNPGTGKTTVVRIYGALLKQLGLLSSGEFISCTPADLTGDAEGSAAANTKAMLEKARGKVLFIDEAYVLDPTRKANQYGGNVLDTLVEKLDGDIGSDIAVILAGYTREMFDMLGNNPGLRRRFNIDDFGVPFEDMSDIDLKQARCRPNHLHTLDNIGVHSYLSRHIFGRHMHFHICSVTLHSR
jgi:replication-associated recombination protein RarA